MGQLASYCCRSDHEAANEQVDGCNHGCIKQEQIFHTCPPCWHGYRCECPCHHGGVCIYKLKSK